MTCAAPVGPGLLRDVVPDVVLADIRMPRMSGIELASHIRRKPRLHGVRVVMLTTFADDDYLVAAAREGAAGYLLKSMPPADIRAGVRARWVWCVPDRAPEPVRVVSQLSPPQARTG